MNEHLQYAILLLVTIGTLLTLFLIAYLFPENVRLRRQVKYAEEQLLRAEHLADARVLTIRELQEARDALVKTIAHVEAPPPPKKPTRRRR